MSNNIDLKQGLNIPISGTAAQKTRKTIVPDVIAIKPTDFKGLIPRLLVKEGDKVLAGSPVLSDKKNPDILFTSPVSGTVAEIVRGEKRKLLEVRIKADAQQEFVDFGTHKVADMSAADIKSLLLQSGLWPSLIQRPYGILADPALTPKAIFVSAFTTAPLAAVPEFAFKDEIAYIQTGVNVLAKLTDGGVHFSLSSENYSGTPLHKIENVIQHVFSGKYDMRRKVAVTGPKAIDPAYVDALPGISMKDLKDFYDNSANDLRFVSGDVLTGENVGENGFLGFFDNQVTLLHEGTEREVLGWAKPFRFGKFSSSRTYFSWLCPKKTYDMDTNFNGGPRAFVMSDVYGKVLPMDIFPIYLAKACLAGDIDKMEKFGIYEVLPEDLALCEYVDPSKNDIQAIIQKGIDLMIKEMA